MRARLSHNLRLAEQLGAEVVTLSGESATDEILRFARQRNITKLILGKPLSSSWRDRLRPSLVDQLIRQSGDIDVYVTAGDPDDQETAPDQVARAPLHVPSLVAAVAVPLLATGVTLLAFGRDQLPDVVMIYMLGIMLIASRFGLGASVLAAFLSVAAFDFCFVRVDWHDRVALGTECSQGLVAELRSVTRRANHGDDGHAPS